MAERILIDCMAVHAVKLRIEAGPRIDPDILSVQVSQTPACMRGPASIRGPACIITCQVYVILFKKSSTFMFTGYQYFVYFHTITSHIEKVQKRATKFIISLKKYSYKDCLIQLNLPTLKYRRLRWNMIEVFKIVKQKYERCKMVLTLILCCVFVIMHCVRCLHRGVRAKPIVARLYYVMTLLSFPKLV